MTKPANASLVDWLAVLAGTLGALMAVLDISVVNSSMPTIQGEIGANGSESTWVSTSFLTAEIVIIPLSGWLTRLLGLRVLLFWAVSLFVLSSVICGLSTNLITMIIGRTGQGISGGVLIPTAFTIIALRLPPHQQAVGTAAFGATAILGPVLGPIIGGWLTEYWSWHYAFFINVPIGFVLAGLVLITLPSQPFRRELLGEIDWLGILGLVIGLGSLTILLEEGNRERWFESPTIIGLTILSGAGFFALFLGYITAPHPVLKLSLLLDRSFGSVFVISVIFGLILYGIIFLIPQFLAQVSHYNALQAGEVVFLSGIPAMAVMPLVPLMFRHVDCRIAITVGLVVLGISCFWNSALTIDSDGTAFTAGQLLRGGGQAMMMLYLNQTALNAVGARDIPDASGLFNTARNLGGSIGLAILATVQDQRLALHQARLREGLAANSAEAQEWATGFAAQVGEAADQAFRALAGEVGLQSLVMTYNDLFFLMGCSALLVAPLALLLRPLRRTDRLAH